MARVPDFKPTVPRMAAVGGSAPHFWLVLHGRQVALTGVKVIGRSPQCEIALDDPLASRRHAQVTVTTDGVVIEDLGSANGVMVDGRLISGERMLLGGERIRIGQNEMVLHAGSASEAPPIHRQSAITQDSSSPPPDDGSEEDPTAPAQDVLAIIGAVFEKALARGDLAEAARLLGPVMKLLGDEVAVSGKIEPEAGRRLTRYALDLAERTKSGEWIRQLVAFHRAALRPMPTEAVDRLYALVRKVDMPKTELAEYSAALTKIEARFGPTERFAMRRLEGLVKIAKG